MMIKDDMTRPTGKLAAQHHVYSHIIMMNNAILLFSKERNTIFLTRHSIFTNQKYPIFQQDRLTFRSLYNNTTNHAINVNDVITLEKDVSGIILFKK